MDKFNLKSSQKLLGFFLFFFLISNIFIKCYKKKVKKNKIKQNKTKNQMKNEMSKLRKPKMCLLKHCLIFNQTIDENMYLEMEIGT